MSLIYVTGLSGSGKSALSDELKRRGFKSHDADGEGFNGWYENETGKIVKITEWESPHSPAWHKKHSWRTSRQKVILLKNRAKNKLVFLCGTSSNEKDVWDLFDKVICLVIDEATLRNRIATRTSNDFGKNQHELEMVLKWHKTYPGDYLKMGAIIVDANRPLNVVVDDVLKIAEK